jgi:hypothetical protein
MFWKLSLYGYKKKEINGPNGFEGLLRYYMKLSSTQFIEQWVTLELYNEFSLYIFSTCVTPLNGDKDRPDFQCVYCGKEWSNKLQLFNHRAKGCPNAPRDLGTNNPLFILELSN